jgi:hypothetical protein
MKNVYFKESKLDYVVIDEITDEIIASNFECKNHAELFVEVHKKDYPNAILYVESL